MIKITDKSLCCGCAACAAICPAQCISMCRDSEGFDYPVAVSEHCIGCGRCDSVCPMHNPPQAKESLVVVAARSETYVHGSSSGGVFPSLSEAVIAEGGVVYGAVFKPDFKVCHVAATEMSKVEAMRGSKYVQSDIRPIFKEAEKCLSEGRKVLFAGTPCQVAGLKNYLGREYEGLIAVDCACHGVPSPGLWERYVDALEKRNGRPLKNVVFRDKSRGWRHYCVRRDDVLTPYIKDPYMALFVQDMTLRPSCFGCRMRGARKAGDLTLADLWSVGTAAPEFDDDRGVSAIFVNTPKGNEFLQSISANLVMKPTNPEEARRDNGGFDNPPCIPNHRKEFWDGIADASDLIGYMGGFVKRRPLGVRLYRWIRSLLSQIKRRII